MKNKCFILIFYVFRWASPLSAQVIDSTFGEPYSFASPDYFIAGVTACNYDNREDRNFSTLYLEDGRIIMAGYTKGGDGVDFAFVRLLANGQYDQSVGPDGKIRLDLGYGNDSCLAAALYENNKIMMGGCAMLTGHSNYVNLLVRLDLDGNLDNSFGNDGQLIVDLPSDHEMITKILTTADGKILIGGNVTYGSSFTFPDSTLIFFGRLMPTGAIDSSFGTNGFVYRRFEEDCNSSLLGDMVLDKNACILASGDSYHPYPTWLNTTLECSHNINIFRFLPNGTFDPTFGTEGDGSVELPHSQGRVNGLFVDEDEGIFILGVWSFTGFSVPDRTFIAKLLPNGNMDSTFGVNGRFKKVVFGGTGPPEPIGMLRIKDKLVIGYVDEPLGNHITFGLFGLTKNGDIDLDFGKMGVFSYISLYPTTAYHINNIHLLDSQHVCLGGYYRILTHDNMMVCKVNLKNLAVSESSPSSPIPSLIVYPNPASDQVYARIPDGSSRLLVRDLRGLTCLTSEPLRGDSKEILLDVRGLVSGMYLVTAVDEAGRSLAVGRLVVLR